MLIGQLQTSIQRILAYNKSILICHNDSAKTNIGLFALFDTLRIVNNVLLDE